MHFAEFFERFDIAVPRLERTALVWGHCHHKATGGMSPEHQLLERMGMRVEPVSGGCCGLAGSWGFEKGHHEISMQCGEQALLPAVRAAAQDTIVVANGFSCKTQIEQSDANRRALHIAQVMKMAHEHGPRGSTSAAPETPYYAVKPTPRAQREIARTTAMGTGAAIAAAAIGHLARRDRARR
jgi:hypothetical protein